MEHFVPSQHGYLRKLSGCGSNIDGQLQTCHLSQLIGSYKNLRKFSTGWICLMTFPLNSSKDYGSLINNNYFRKHWRPRRTCQYPLYSGRQKQLTTRNAVSPEMSTEITCAVMGIMFHRYPVSLKNCRQEGPQKKLPICRFFGQISEG